MLGVDSHIIEKWVDVNKLDRDQGKRHGEVVGFILQFCKEKNIKIHELDEYQKKRLQEIMDAYIGLNTLEGKRREESIGQFNRHSILADNNCAPNAMGVSREDIVTTVAAKLNDPDVSDWLTAEIVNSYMEGRLDSLIDRGLCKPLKEFEAAHKVNRSGRNSMLDQGDFHTALKTACEARAVHEDYLKHLKENEVWMGTKILKSYAKAANIEFKVLSPTKDSKIFTVSEEYHAAQPTRTVNIIFDAKKKQHFDIAEAADVGSADMVNQQLNALFPPKRALKEFRDDISDELQQQKVLREKFDSTYARALSELGNRLGKFNDEVDEMAFKAALNEEKAALKEALRDKKQLSDEIEAFAEQTKPPIKF